MWSQPEERTERAWNMTHDTLLTCPRSVSTSQAFVSARMKAQGQCQQSRVLQLQCGTATSGISDHEACNRDSPFMRHSLTCRSSAPDTMSGSVGWKACMTIAVSHFLITGSVSQPCSLPQIGDPVATADTWSMQVSAAHRTAQLTPRSWPSSTYLTTASPPPNRSEFICRQQRCLTRVYLEDD